MTKLDIDASLRNSITWEGEADEDTVNTLLSIPENDEVVCDGRTRLKLMSRPIDVRGILGVEENKKPVWHLTPLFHKDIAVRVGSRDSSKSEENFIQIEGSRIIGNLKVIVQARHWGQKVYLSTYLRPSAPSVIPTPIIELGKRVNKYCTPYVLYKPEEWKEVKADPALVFEISDDEWRVIAVWGDVVEQAEIIKFTKKE